MGQEDIKHRGQVVQPFNLQSFYSQPPVSQNQFNDGIEVIDLDDPRRDVKPTTWH